MESNHDRSLIPQPSQGLAAPLAAPNRILAIMVESSLAVAKESADKEHELDAIVREAKLLQENAAGRAMSANNVRAFQLFLQAAIGGHVEAQAAVADCFGYGVGVALDIAECDRWLRLAAESGNAHAQWTLGMYRSRTDSERVKWLRKSAERGESDAQMMLAGHYSSGRGVPQDYCEAYAWLKLSQDDSGDGWLQEQIAAVTSWLDANQLRRAHELYRVFKANYSAKQ